MLTKGALINICLPASDYQPPQYALYKKNCILITFSRNIFGGMLKCDNSYLKIFSIGPTFAIAISAESVVSNVKHDLKLRKFCKIHIFQLQLLLNIWTHITINCVDTVLQAYSHKTNRDVVNIWTQISWFPSMNICIKLKHHNISFTYS